MALIDVSLKFPAGEGFPWQHARTSRLFPTAGELYVEGGRALDTLKDVVDVEVPVKFLRLIENGELTLDSDPAMIRKCLRELFQWNFENADKHDGVIMETTASLAWCTRAIIASESCSNGYIKDYTVNKDGGDSVTLLSEKAWYVSVAGRYIQLTTENTGVKLFPLSALFESRRGDRERKKSLQGQATTAAARLKATIIQATPNAATDPVHRALQETAISLVDSHFIRVKKGVWMANDPESGLRNEEHKEPWRAYHESLLSALEEQRTMDIDAREGEEDATAAAAAAPGAEGEEGEEGVVDDSASVASCASRRSDASLSLTKRKFKSGFPRMDNNTLQAPAEKSSESSLPQRTAHLRQLHRLDISFRRMDVELNALKEAARLDVAACNPDVDTFRDFISVGRVTISRSWRNKTWAECPANDICGCYAPFAAHFAIVDELVSFWCLGSVKHLLPRTGSGALDSGYVTFQGVHSSEEDSAASKNPLYSSQFDHSPLKKARVGETASSASSSSARQPLPVSAIKERLIVKSEQQNEVENMIKATLSKQWWDDYWEKLKRMNQKRKRLNKKFNNVAPVDAPVAAWRSATNTRLLD